MFKLVIESTKDIDKLSIDFADGSSVVQESPKKTRALNEPHEHKEIKKSKKSKKVENKSFLDKDFLDTEEEETKEIHQSIVEKPNISDISKERSVKVANELQNLNI